MNTLTSGVRRTTLPRAMKFLSTVGERQLRVVASDGTPDRMGDVLEPQGVKLAAYKANPIVLAQHDLAAPIARSVDIRIVGAAVVATVEFPPAGTSYLSDQYSRLVKAAVLGAVSVGFLPITWEPIRGGGMRFTSWELLELSIVSVPANPSALVTERSFNGDTGYVGRLARVAELRGSVGASSQWASDAYEAAPSRLPSETPAEARASIAAMRLRHGLRISINPAVIAAESACRLRLR